jgi:hypothetical protein
MVSWRGRDSDPIHREHTVASHLKINDIANAHIDDTEEALVLLLEFLLVENLNRENAVLVDSPTAITPVNTNILLFNIQVARKPSRTNRTVRSSRG